MLLLQQMIQIQKLIWGGICKNLGPNGLKLLHSVTVTAESAADTTKNPDYFYQKTIIPHAVVSLFEKIKWANPPAHIMRAFYVPGWRRFIPNWFLKKCPFQEFGWIGKGMKAQLVNLKFLTFINCMWNTSSLSLHRALGLINSGVFIYRMQINNDDQGSLMCLVFKQYMYYKKMLSALKLGFKICLETNSCCWKEWCCISGKSEKMPKIGNWVMI